MDWRALFVRIGIRSLITQPNHTTTKTPTNQEREALQYMFDALDGPQAQTDMDFDYLTGIAESQLGACGRPWGWGWGGRSADSEV